MILSTDETLELDGTDNGLIGDIIISQAGLFRRLSEDILHGLETFGNKSCGHEISSRLALVSTIMSMSIMEELVRFSIHSDR